MGDETRPDATPMPDLIATLRRRWQVIRYVLSPEITALKLYMDMIRDDPEVEPEPETGGTADGR